MKRDSPLRINHSRVNEKFEQPASVFYHNSEYGILLPISMILFVHPYLK